ncbi:hypothetical protein N7508_007160 [Penicillium antarcticum]|uniref:uncharacterized protein n=1 Tax=Penicillium antarcticum TaxID=416450 RepID=UPI0023A17ED1|nr:uncharacterized protein N7508_007160 [Penicillium antarcticum]KAJ5302297.1 hypothetical protein N7508_007160 [Penicillium antarcticum]
MSQRMFDFHGDDQAYISFLECQLISAQWAGFMEFPNTARGEILQEVSSTNSVQFVPYTPSTSHARSSNPGQNELPWKRQLDSFISALPTEKTWSEARKRAGIDTPIRNQLAVRLMLGHTNHATFRWVQQTASISRTLPSEDQDLVRRGYQYAQFINRCAGDLSFKTSVVSFQQLIFVSYCTVLIQFGVTKDTVNDMMRRYIDRNNDDSTLEGYRRGVVWINRCIAALLANGWGHKSWEIFLLEKRSLAQFARFAAYDAQSYRTLVQRLQKANVPLQEDGWTPYSIPCIVQCLAGNNIELWRICHILGYGPLQESPVLSLSPGFMYSFKQLAGEPAEPSVGTSLPPAKAPLE